MTMGIEGGFLKMTKDDELFDKFKEGEIEEDELSKLTGESPNDEETKDDNARSDNLSEQTEPEAESGSDEDEAKDGVEEDREQEEGRSEPDRDRDEKRAKAESNQAKALRVERESRKRLERALKAQAERSKKIEDVLTKVLQPEEPKEAVPDPEEDPVGYQNHKIELLERRQKEYAEHLRQQKEYQYQQQQEQQFMSAYAEKAREFSKETPDFMNAYNHLVSERIQEHLIAGYDERIAHEILKQEEAAIVAKAFEDGENPAARLYALAQRRGYQNTAKPTNQPKTSKLQSLKQGIKTNRSLGSNAGSAARESDSMDITDIDNMSDAEVDKLFKLYKAGKIAFN